MGQFKAGGEGWEVMLISPSSMHSIKISPVAMGGVMPRRIMGCQMMQE